MKTNWTKLGLMPSSGLEYFHVIESDGVFADYSGNNRHISAASNAPPIITEQIGKYSAFYFDGTKSPLITSTLPDLLIKHIFIVAKFDGSVFTGFNGLLSDFDNLAVLFGNDADSVKFFNLGLGFDYRKNNVVYAESNLAAPMNEWALIEIQKASGMPFGGWQIGQDREDTTRKWKGWFAGDAAFSRVLSADERRRAILYYNLRFGNYLGTPVTLEFPDAKMTGINYSRFYEVPPDFDEITVTHKYQDAGRSFNENSGVAPLRWEVKFAGLTYDQMRIFDEFNNRARRTTSFDFTDKYGETHSGVYIESYERNHDAHKSWIYEVNFKLAKYP